ncbi:MAG: GDP-L-fucose synthase [Deltaproteobacteria bacterium]|nr:GDP-L-fucose synthase [Deltaproteobacteria bacterium]
MTDNKNKKILVTGAKGMVGHALVKHLQEENYKNILAVGRTDLDLTDSAAVDSYFDKYRPDFVYMIAAKVGGIAANMSDPVGFLVDNLKIELNLYQACHKYKTAKNLFLGSSCIYPKECPQPMKENYLLTGTLEPTNEGYALSKITGLRLAEYYYQQYGMLTVCPMPCNIYGTGDHFDLQKSHVLSALVKRFIDAVDEQTNSVTLWGTGIARREFIHVDDVAQALLFFMETHSSPEFVNLGTGKDITIRELAELIAREADYQGKIVWDESKPNGMLKKCLDITKLEALGFTPQVSLKKGVQKTIAEYRQIKQQLSRDNK